MNSNSARRGGGSTLELEQRDLQYFCDLIEERAGIHLKPAKFELVKTRLRSRIAAHEFDSFSEYRDLLSSLPSNHSEWEVFINLLTTNKTDFFREPKHFEHLVETILPEWLKTSAKTFKVWSAACSTGEEPYTLAMVLERHLPKDRDFKILATDIDTNVLAVAHNAVYPVSKRCEIPAEYHANGIEVGRGEASGWFRVKPKLKEKVMFRQHNLIEHMAPGESTFDLVLCRNVLIYFASDSIDFVQAKLYATAKKGGHLYIGHAESLQGLKHSWQTVAPAVFKK